MNGRKLIKVRKGEKITYRRGKSKRNAKRNLQNLEENSQKSKTNNQLLYVNYVSFSYMINRINISFFFFFLF